MTRSFALRAKSDDLNKTHSYKMFCIQCKNVSYKEVTKIKLYAIEFLWIFKRLMSPYKISISYSGVDFLHMHTEKSTDSC